MNLRYWLARTKPSVVVGVDASEKEHRIVVNKTHKSKWMLVVKSLDAIGAVKCIAYDDDENILDSADLDGAGGDDPDARTAEDIEREKKEKAERDAAAVSADREVRVAEAIARGIERGLEIFCRAMESMTARNADEHAANFAQLFSLVKLSSDRLSARERQMDSMLSRREKEIEARKGEMDPNDQMANMVLEKAMEKFFAGGAPKLNGAAANGTHRAEPPAPKPDGE